MRLFLLLTLVMCAFAANSLLTRAGAVAGADPMAFALWRVAAGAIVLTLLSLRQLPVLVTSWRDLRGRALGAGALTVYLLGFTFSSKWVEAGVGALILFGTVQLGLFALALVAREAVPGRKWVGMIIAMGGLTWLLWPTSIGTPGVAAPIGALLMVLGGLGWAGYTWLGRGTTAPLPASAGNFGLAAVVFVLCAGFGAPVALPPDAIPLALVSGAVTSGLGYALWFKVLPSIQATTAGVAQLSVPVIALLAGAALLGEALTAKTILASAVVLGGIAVATVQIKRA